MTGVIRDKGPPMRLLVAALVCWLLATGPAAAAKRVALVVGNDTYSALPVLRNAAADAETIATTLQDLGFQTLKGINLGRREMSRRLADLEAALEPGDTAFFFFAGHGVSIGGDSILLPIDMPKVRDGEENVVRDEGQPVDTIIRRIQARGAAVSFVIIDACRENPFQQAGTRSIGQARGLTRVDAPKGVFVLFSAGTAQTALDRLNSADTHANSVFTRRLAPLLRTPGLSHVSLAKRVQQEVSDLAASVQHQQQPAFYDQILGEFVLSEGVTLRPPAAAPPPSVATPAPAARDARPARSIVALPRAGSATGFRDTAADGTPCPTCPDLVVVPAGTFKMGSPTAEPERVAGEMQTEVRIAAPLAVARHAVTRADYARFLAESGHTQAAGCRIWDGATWTEGAGFGWRTAGFVQADNHPVVCVTWHDATAYAAWLTRKTGHTYRLLSESEREYAARAGTTTPFWWGRTIAPTQANYRSLDVYKGGGQVGPWRKATVPVEAFKPNPWGLFNVHGNVREWTLDCWADTHADNPGDGRPRVAGDCTRRVVRGGCWCYNPGNVRAAFRLSGFSGARLNVVGFRLAREVE